MTAGLVVLTLVAVSFSAVLFDTPGLVLALLFSGGAWYIYFAHYLPMANAAALRARRLSQQLDSNCHDARQQYTLAVETLRQYRRRPVMPTRSDPVPTMDAAAASGD